ncbi:MAG TPA: glycosyltransferase [Candidatus Competibacteraceae bacterium]|nr:glycosyltransferase [Candidatus Competibacteraceae bacterium]
MRIVLDLQGAQGSSAKRGIGRYTLSLAHAIIRNRGEHEVLIALNGLFPETIEPIRAVFDGLLPQENIRVWQAPGPVGDIDPTNTWRRKVAENLREAFLANLRPDIIHVTSLFEGFGDNAVTSIGAFLSEMPTAVTLYDLIPYIHHRSYLKNPAIESWYLKKIDHLRRADLWLAISESSRREGIDYLGLPQDRVVNISTAADAHFRRLKISSTAEQGLRQKYGLTRPFLMYTGGIDPRKNIERLIRSFAKLPVELRRAHQLAIVCSVQPESRSALEQLIRQQSLKSDEVILTGFVPEEDLVALYNLCKLFVFPSWHEGFGLPALEAMSCGAPVIAANTSSLPEVIGREDALFDPFSDAAITSKIAQVITDAAFRGELARHSLEQANKFSWNESAKRAIAAFENFHSQRKQATSSVHFPGRRPKLAYISPLPPERSGIADYSAELLPELARYYDIEVIIAQAQVSDAWIKACCPIRTVEWFVEHADRYDRVLYHFGNSDYHRHMFELLERCPGVVVLHDFFLSGIQVHREKHGLAPHAWVRELYQAHGYSAIQERFHARDMADVVFKYPCNFSVVHQAVGVIAHSAYSGRLADDWYGAELANDWSIIPLLRVPARLDRRGTARSNLGLAEDEFVICSFGLLGPTKQNHRLLEAWLASGLAQDSRCKLIFVGENHGGQYGSQLQEAIRRSGLQDRILITGWTDAERFRHYLAAADMAVQLRTLSRGETSAAVLDCMNYGLPTIVNANGSMADLPADAVWLLPDEFDDKALIAALESLWRDGERRLMLSLRAREVIRSRHAPRACAEQYARAIESFYASAQTDRRALVQAIAALENAPPEGAVWGALAESIAQNMPLKRPARQLLVDISELVQRDARSGIQRVVRSVLKELLANPPAGYRVEPVYATPNQPNYRYARQFTLRFLDCLVDGFEDTPIEAQQGDIFLGLDLQPNVVPSQADYLAFLRRIGVQVYFVVYDLLPVLLPHSFPEGAAANHVRWLQTIAQADGALCISRAVADELTEWLQVNGPQRLRPFQIGWFHLGADVAASIPTQGMPVDGEQVLNALSSCPSFLMVSTLEPRKGHAQTLAAFEQLWEEGVHANLVIVGKQGWMVEALVKKLRHHRELGKRLFWLEGISDEYLEKVYAASTCLIAASEGEGFGLPLIEAAQHKLPIIARDIPVFREVAGDHAFYFSGMSGEDLAGTIKRWLALFEAGKQPSVEKMPWLTWRESAERLKDIILGDRWYSRWMPGQERRTARFSGHLFQPVAADMEIPGVENEYARA